MRVNSQVRQQAQDLKSWQKWVKSGNFVQLSLGAVGTGSKSGAGKVPEVLSISAYDQPLFLPLDMTVVCRP